MGDTSGYRERKVLGGAFMLAAAGLAVKILGLIFKVPLSHLIDDEGMGYFNAAYTIYASVYLIAVSGLPSSVSIMTSELSGLGLHRDKERMFRITLGFFAKLGAVCTLAMVAFAPLLSGAIGNSNASYAVALVAPAVFFISVSSVYRGYLQGENRMSHVAVSQLIEAVFKLVLGIAGVIIGIKRGLSLPVTAALGVVGIAVGSAVSMLYLKICTNKYISNERIDVAEKSRFSDRDIKRRLLSLCLPVSLSAGVMSITNIIDLSFMMNRLTNSGFSESEAAALYGNYTTLAVPMLNLTAIFIAPICASALPLLTELRARGMTEKYEASALSTIKIIAYISVPFALGLAAFPYEILSIIYKDSSASVAAPLLAALAPAVVMLSLLSVTNVILQSASHPSIPLLAMSIGAVAKLIFGFFTIGGESGIVGAPLGTVVCYAVALIVNIYYIYRYRIIKLSVISAVVRPLVFSLISVSGSAWLIKRFFDLQSGTVHLIVTAALSALIYAVLLLAFDKFWRIKLVEMSKRTKVVE